MQLLDIKNIGFAYGNNPPALNEISFSAGRGEFIVILGPNGSGKTTLLKNISGVLAPGSGRILLEGEDIHKIPPRKRSRKIAYVPQTFYTLYPFSVNEIVMMGRTPYLSALGFESDTDRQKVREALEIVEISHLAHKGINEISGGEAQRAFIARAIAQDTEIIMLDEPNAHLDIKHQISIYRLLKELNETKQLTVITISHDLNLSGAFSKRAIMLKNGRLFADDLIFNILTEENIKKVFGVDSEVKTSDNSEKVSVTILPGKLD